MSAAAPAPGLCDSGGEMTDVRDRSPAQPENGDTRPVPLFAGALTTSLWAVVVGIAPLAAVVLVVWVAGASSGSGATDAVRFALGAWLLAHGAPLTLGGATLGLAPLGLTALVVWQLVRAGANTARAVGADGLGLGLRVVGAVTVTYTVVATVLASFAGSGQLGVSLPRAVLSTAVLAALASAAGVLRIAEVREAVLARCDDRVPQILRGGAIAAAGVLGAGTLVAGLRVVLAVDHAAELVRALNAGPVGTVGVLVLCVLYAPTAAVWGAAYLVGPGFAIGTGTSVTALGVHLGPLPAVPLLAGLPDDPLAGGLMWLFVLPFAAGIVAGVRLARTGPPGWRPLLGAAALTGPVAGLLVGLAAVAAGGPLGGGRLAAVGPSAWQVGLACAAWVAVAAVAGAAVHRGLRRR
ncbi:MAG: hypothetical protein QOC93_993 [Actinomycetota bacterium]|nr:hypothetical protein [Actinomycetota bacterium]